MLGRVFKGEQIGWLEFLSLTNDKNIIQNKEGLITLTDKWLKRKFQNEVEKGAIHSQYADDKN